MDQTIKKIKKGLKDIEKSKNIIAKERDKLRDIYGEIEMLLESLDESIKGIEEGKKEIENSLDTLSQYV